MQRYELLCQHYAMKPTRNNQSVAHENGAIESPHGHLKRAIKDALLLRGSAAFESLEQYRAFVDQIIARHNARHSARIDVERATLTPLPALRSEDYEQHSVTVTRSGGFTLKQGVLQRTLTPDRPPSTHPPV